MSQLRRDAHAVLFPVLTSLGLDDHVARILDEGGCSLLFGESSDEYRTGRMEAGRIQTETAEAWHRAIARARSHAPELLAAVDEDISAVHRLHVLTPPPPSLTEAQAMRAEQLEEVAFGVAKAARALGVNVLLSPTADVVVGRNDWLAGRTLGGDVTTVSRLVAPYVRGIERAGVAATLKHFPGHPTLSGVPATEAAVVPGRWADVDRFLGPFAAGIAAGSRAVMMGPAVFAATTPPVAASISPELIALLRGFLGFSGLVMTCDIDHAATLLPGGVGVTAVAALRAGADLVLLSPVAALQVPAIIGAIMDAVERGTLATERLSTAAATVRALARDLSL